MCMLIITFKHILLYLSNNIIVNYLGKRASSGMRYRYNVSCSETLATVWTPTAIECYELGCCCSKCNLYRLFFSNGENKCYMKETVIELVRKIGAPMTEKDGKD